MTIQEMVDIAMRYETAMSDALIIACIQHHYLTGEPLAPPTREMARRCEQSAARHESAYELEDTELRAMVERNSDTRHQHC